MGSDLGAGGATDCMSCSVLKLMGTAFQHYDQTIFHQLASGVTTVGATITAVALMIGVMMRSHMGLDAQMGRDGANYFFGTLARLAFAMGVLASYPIWHNVILGTVHNAINAAIFAAVPYSGFHVSSSDPTTPMLQTLNAVEQSIREPISRLWDAILNSVSGWSPGKSFALFMMGLVSLCGAAVILAIIALMFAEMQLWVFLLSAFGPLLAFAWVFPETRPAVWTGFKTLIQAGLGTLMATAVAAIAVEAFKTLNLPTTYENGHLIIDMDHLSDVASFSSFGEILVVMVMVVLMLIVVKVAAVFVVFGGIPGVPGIRGR